MTDIITRLQDAIHLESAAIAPRTSPLIEAAKEAIGEIERLMAALKPFAEAAESLEETHKDHADIWESSAAMCINVSDLRAAKHVYEQNPTLPTATPEQDKYFGPVKAQSEQGDVWRCCWLWKPGSYGDPDDIMMVPKDWDGQIPDGFDRYRLAGQILIDG